MSLKCLHFSACILGLAGLIQASGALAADSCNAYFTRSQSLAALLSPAYTAMNSKDAAAQKAALPGLEAQLNALPASEIKAEVCDGNHINAYTSYQYIELGLLRANGINRFPANLTLVKQPDLNQASLAYVVGWIKYEQKDYTGALAAYAKGLAMFPHDHSLQQEYMAALLQLGRYKDLVDFDDKVLADTLDYDDVTLAKAYSSRAVAEMGLGNMKESDDAFTVSLRYNYTNDVADMQKQVRDVMATKK
jgi:tetratricopeptide (TPR) repeat protein